MEMGKDAKTTRFTRHNILIIPQKISKGSVEPSKNYGRKYWN